MAAHESLEFTCSMCEYKTSDKWRLRYHKQSEQEGVKFSCNICKHKACIRSNLSTHMINKHKKENIFVILSSSGPDPVQVNSRCLPGHMNLHLYLKLERSGPGADSIIATYHPPPTTTHTTFLSEIS